MDDEPLPGERAAAMASAAAEAVRGLNHAAGGEGIGLPSAAYDVLGALSLAASRLGPALAEISRYLDRALADGILGCDLGDGPCFAVDAAGTFLDDARLHAASLAGDLSAAQVQIASLNALASLKEEQP
ncbi:MAG: hypothetical protein J2P25_23750 [Nocardiopsaceae bacterium]|nr:hypothetical protein [Nocardiopsaceae bacterium]